MEKLTDKLFTVKYNEDTGSRTSRSSTSRCVPPNARASTARILPAGVYEWNAEQKKTLVSFGNCIECGACSIGCPFDNITCHSPRGGYGAQFKHG